MALRAAAGAFRPVPTREIDIVWHAHILMTRKYEQDCLAELGSVVHHDPLYGVRTVEEGNQYTSAKLATFQAFADTFGIGEHCLVTARGFPAPPQRYPSR